MMIRLSRRRGRGAVARGEQPARDVKGIRLIILRILNGLDLVVYALVGVAFVAAAVLAFVISISNVLRNFGLVLPLSDGPSGSQWVQVVLNFVSDLLLVLIIMELLGTIRSYVEKGDTSVEPFLTIGIISATRGILSIGARLYISGATLTPDEFRNAMIELAINALVIIVLGITMRILDGLIYQPERDQAPGPTSSRTSSHAPGEREDHDGARASAAPPSHTGSSSPLAQ